MLGFSFGYHSLYTTQHKEYKLHSDYSQSTNATLANISHIYSVPYVHRPNVPMDHHFLVPSVFITSIYDISYGPYGTSEPTKYLQLVFMTLLMDHHFMAPK